jgi:DNA modification methylase
LIKPYYEDKQAGIVIYCGDCREILPQLDVKADLVLTDPPYPDQHLEYGSADITCLNLFDCRQLVFWSPKADFPLDYTAIHIWDKKTGCACQYERIFERHGQESYKVYRAYLINSSVAANYTGDIFTGHPSQKAARLIKQLLTDNSHDGDLILDPFLGSGTTALAAKILGRKCIGIELEEKYCKIAVERLRQSVMRLDEPPPEITEATALL